MACTSPERVSAQLDFTVSPELSFRSLTDQPGIFFPQSDSQIYRQPDLPRGSYDKSLATAGIEPDTSR